MLVVENYHKTTRAILKLMKERYKGCRYCFFYGSAATESGNSKSDVDLVIVYENTIHSYREKFLYANMLMDVFAFDEETLYGSLNMARINGNFVTVEAVINGITLPAPTPESDLLKAQASLIRKAGYRFEGATFMRQYVTNILDDLEDCTVATERNMLCIDLFKKLCDIILARDGVGISDRKHAARKLAEISFDMHARLDSGLLVALSGDTGILIDAALEVLESIGGPLRDGFQMKIPNAVRLPLPVI